MPPEASSVRNVMQFTNVKVYSLIMKIGRKKLLEPENKHEFSISLFFIDRSITRSYGSIDFVQMLEKYVRDGYSSKNDTNRVNLHFGQNSNLVEYEFF